jgi:selenocysteine-specific elongation factor
MDKFMSAGTKGMKQVILGTAGHIDHGKTSLIKALTGIDTDRLKEEKERGITIELGFAHLELPSSQLVGIVDVPGHERFVKNMVAGATGIDLVALIIAADEGVMPQTKEHMEICQLLRIKNGLVVLTKIDIVEQDWLELVREDVSEFLSGTFLANASIIEVSSVNGTGLEELRLALDTLVKEIPERDTGHCFRLPIDRVFTMKGFGTVITGTTISGEIRNGDEVTIYPQKTLSRIRGIQVHNREVKEVRAGLRTAVNLQGVEKAQIQRGNIIAAKDSLRPTYMVDVVLELLPSAPRKLKNRARVRFHTGTSEIISTVILLDREELKQGESCLAQIRLEQPTALLRRDRYVIRSYSPVRTIGGGEILNALPVKKRRFSKATISELQVLSAEDLTEITEQFIRMGRFQGVDEKELPILANVKGKRLEAILKALISQRKIIQYDKDKGVFIHAEHFSRAREEIISTLTKYHREFPLRVGLSKEELRSRTVGAQNQKLYNTIINQLIHEGELAQEGEALRLKEHRVTLAQDQEKVRVELEKIYMESGLQPPYFREIRDKFPGRTGLEVLQVMAKDGVLVKVKEDLYFHQEAIRDLKEKLIHFLKDKGEISTPQFKDMTGVSRKYTIPLIEYFDGSQITVRVGDNRVLRKK